MHRLETVLVVSAPWTLALAKFLALAGLGATASVVQWLGRKQQKSPSTITATALLSAGAYTAALTDGLMLASSANAWHVPVGLGVLVLAAVAVFVGQRVWRHPSPARPIGSSSAAIAAQAQGPVETVWLMGASTRVDDGVWPQLVRVATPRDAEALIASPDFLGRNEHLLYRTRLFFARAIPEMTDASVFVTQARLLVTDGTQVFTIPRTRLRAVAYRQKEPMALGAKGEAIVSHTRQNPVTGSSRDSTLGCSSGPAALRRRTRRSMPYALPLRRTSIRKPPRDPGIVAAVQVTAELAGNLWKVVVKEGQQVSADETLMILESMKMEIPVNAPKAGRVTRIHVKEGEAVQEGQLLAEVD